MRSSEEFNGFLNEERIIRLPSEIGLYHVNYLLLAQLFCNHCVYVRSFRHLSKPRLFKKKYQKTCFFLSYN